MYELFAVVCHQGSMDNGHYTNYARRGDEWFRFDDDKLRTILPSSSLLSPDTVTDHRRGTHRVTHATLAQTLAAEPYMAFYAARRLAYAPYQTPSYIRAREVEAKREEQREREKEARRAREVDDALMAIM
jgi:ubiquitin carboxyl-terminal hydrolase 22/27/51